MKKVGLIILLMATYFAAGAQETNTAAPTRTIFAFGGGYSKETIRYIIRLTKKENPKICFMPSASGDNPYAILNWYSACEDLPMRPYVQDVFVASYTSPKTFEEVLLSMDAIVVGGGNTLNMIAIWKAQGIDTVLRKAYNKGIILAGGSAGSLCWFQGGTTDSRPKELSIVQGLAFIPTSHCPHYHSEPLRRPLYFDNIVKGKLNPGYAIDDRGGHCFPEGKVRQVGAADDKNNTYYVSLVNGQIDEKILPVSEILK